MIAEVHLFVVVWARSPGPRPRDSMGLSDFTGGFEIGEWQDRAGREMPRGSLWDLLRKRDQ